MELKCEDKVLDAYNSRIKDIKQLMLNQSSNDNDNELWEYFLCFDYVEPGTFTDQRAGYYRLQISYGGPSEEFRIYLNGDMEFWYLDWFDGAPITVPTKDRHIIKELMERKPEGPNVNWRDWRDDNE